MGETTNQAPAGPPPPEGSSPPADSAPSPSFDPSRMIGIIKRKALIKELAAAYHTECLAYCQELLELQKNKEEPFIDTKPPEGRRRDTVRPAKRMKKSR